MRRQAYRATICVETGLDIRKKNRMIRILPVIGEKPASSMQAKNTEITDVVAAMAEACKREYTSGKTRTPIFPPRQNSIARIMKTDAIVFMPSFPCRRSTW